MSKRASFNPDTFVKGGLIDDIDATLTGVKCEMYDYNGNVIPPNPALGVDIVYGEGEDDMTRQYWSAGNHQDWAASEDGKFFIPVGQKTAFSQSCNMFHLFKSLKEAGFDMAKLDGDDGVTALNGLRVHMIRIAAPKRSGLATKKKVNPATGKEYDDTILVVQSILGAEGAGAKDEPKAESKAGATDAGDAEKQAVDVVKKYLAANGKLEKKELPTKIYEMLKDNPAKNVILQILFKDEFLNANFNVVEGVIFAKE